MKRHIPVLIILVFIVAIYASIVLFGHEKPLDLVKTGPGTEDIVYSGDLDLNVNSVSITSQEVDRRYDKLSDEERQNVTRDQVLESMVVQTLLLKEAERKGIYSTENEVDAYLSQTAGLDQKSQVQQFSGAGLTLEEYRNNIREMLTINKLFIQELHLADVQITDSEINSSIEQNKEEFQFIYDEGDPQLENVLKNRIKQKLVIEKQQALVDEYVDSLKKNALITTGGKA